MARTQKKESIVVTALQARTNIGKLLNRVVDQRRSLVIEKRGVPRAILVSIRDYVRLAAPEPEVLTIIGEESKAKGTDVLTSQQIDRIIRAARDKKTKRRRFRFDSSLTRTLWCLRRFSLMGCTFFCCFVARSEEHTSELQSPDHLV